MSLRIIKAIGLYGRTIARRAAFRAIRKKLKIGCGNVYASYARYYELRGDLRHPADLLLDHVVIGVVVKVGRGRSVRLRHPPVKPVISVTGEDRPDRVLDLDQAAPGVVFELLAILVSRQVAGSVIGRGGQPADGRDFILLVGRPRLGRPAIGRHAGEVADRVERERLAVRGGPGHVQGGDARQGEVEPAGRHRQGAVREPPGQEGPGEGDDHVPVVLVVPIMGIGEEQERPGVRGEPRWSERRRT
jgi:hypothetical protein